MQKKIDHLVSSLYQVPCCRASATNMDATLRISCHAGGGLRRRRSFKQLFMIGVRTCRTLRLRGLRYFSSTDNLSSGHSRWSKIKHDKAKVDVKYTVSKGRANN